jgi:hypothetical protein
VHRFPKRKSRGCPRPLRFSKRRESRHRALSEGLRC